MPSCWSSSHQRGSDDTVSKAEVVQEMVAGTFPGSGGHVLELRKNYLACTSCGPMI